MKRCFGTSLVFIYIINKVEMKKVKKGLYNKKICDIIGTVRNIGPFYP